MVSTGNDFYSNNNNFLYSSDEENDDVEIMFDDSSDESNDIDDNLNKLQSFLPNKNKLEKLASISSISTENTHVLVELLKKDKINNEIVVSHRKFKNKNDYLLFPDKQNFINYQILELNNLLSKYNNELTSILCDKPDNSLEEYKDRLASLLATNSWNIFQIEKKLINLSTEKEKENQEDNIVSTTGLLNDIIIINIFNQDALDCPICCETITDFEKTPFIKITNCDDSSHIACKDCYLTYLKSNISETFSINCIGGTCKTKISYTSIKKFNETFFNNLIKFSLLQCFNDLNNLAINSCPEQECDNVILTNYQDDSIIDLTTTVNLEPVSCLNCHKFCLSCKKESHSPITCILLKKWFNKINEGNESLNWVLNNTQPCPNCDVDIEKIDGCNHMKCGFCKYEFCWICSKNWEGHGGSFYDCMNKRDMETKKEKNMQNQSFTRFRNYYKFFIESENNMLLDMRLFNNLTSKKLNNLSTLFGMSFVELEFLNDCLRELIQARNMIKYSFALLYFMDQSHNLFYIFTHNQMALFSKIDEISELLLDINMDSTLPNSKRDIKVLQMKPYLIQATSMLKRLQQNLSKCGQDLVEKKLVIYN